MLRHKHPSKTQSKHKPHPREGGGDLLSDEDNSDNELIVPVPGLTPSSRLEVQVARIQLSDELTPADSSSKKRLKFNASARKTLRKILENFST
jgi:hypothetical protein